MAQKYDLTDIGNALSRVMDNPMTKIISSGSIGVLGVVNPDVYKRQLQHTVGRLQNLFPFCVQHRIAIFIETMTAAKTSDSLVAGITLPGWARIAFPFAA